MNDRLNEWIILSSTYLDVKKFICLFVVESRSLLDRSGSACEGHFCTNSRWNSLRSKAKWLR